MMKVYKKADEGRLEAYVITTLRRHTAFVPRIVAHGISTRRDNQFVIKFDRERCNLTQCGFLPPVLGVQLLYEMLEVLASMATEHIVHGRIALRNVLVGHDGHFKLSHFSSATLTDFSMAAHLDDCYALGVAVCMATPFMLLPPRYAAVVTGIMQPQRRWRMNASDALRFLCG